MFQTIWQYDVFEKENINFIKAYKSDGDWVHLFKKADGFIETELIHDIEHPTKFITIDKWRTKESYYQFKAMFKSDYLKMDKQFEDFSKSEIHIGYFDVL